MNVIKAMKAMKVMKVMKSTKRTVIVLMCMAVLGLTACGQKTEAEGKLDLPTLKDEMLAADKSLPEMKCVSSFEDGGEEYFAYLSDVRYDKIQDYFYAYAAAGTAQEVAVIHVRDEKDIKEVEKSIKDHVKSRILTFENYAPDQVATMEKALVFHKDQYVILISSPEPSYLKAALEKALASE